MENVKTFSRVIEEKGCLAYTTRGISMRPLLRQGKDVVVIEKPKKPCGKYDTVLFKRRNGQYVLHRIVKKTNGQYWIVGDNCIGGEMVDEDQIIGIMTSIKRGNRTIKTTDWLYQLYVRIWVGIYPVRIILKKIKLFLYRCYRFAKKRVFG